MKTLIVPCAGRSTRFPGLRPKWLLTHPDGKLMIQKSLEGMDLEGYDQVIFTIVREHADKFDANEILKELFPQKNIKVFILEDFTKSAAETVYRTLVENSVFGAFVIKDSDNFVDFSKLEEVVVLVADDDMKKRLEWKALDESEAE